MSRPTPRVPLLPLEKAKQLAGEIELPAPLAELNIFRVLLRSLEIPIEAEMESWPPDGEKPNGA